MKLKQTLDARMYLEDQSWFRFKVITNEEIDRRKFDKKKIALSS